MLIVAEALRAATEQLSATSDTALLDAEFLMAHALGVSRSAMLLRHMRDASPETFAALVERRGEHEPVAYIAGRQEFYGLDLAVTPDVLIPRGDSETLIEAAKEGLAERPPRGVLDLGTGSGALLLAALSLWLGAEGVGTDASSAALTVAGRNAERLGLARRARLLRGDWRDAGWSDGLGRFDLVLCNPPYVEEGVELDPPVRDFEPASALFAGPDGLDDYRVLIPQLRPLMTPGAVAIFEIGHRQADAVTQIARAAGFAASLRRDLAGRPRALILS